MYDISLGIGMNWWEDGKCRMRGILGCNIGERMQWWVLFMGERREKWTLDSRISRGVIDSSWWRYVQRRACSMLENTIKFWVYV